MTAGGALRAALRDFYRHSWRLVVLNAGLSLGVLALLLAASYAQPALVLLVLAGPLLAALVHCAVTLARTEELTLGCAVSGLELHWRRGLELALLTAAVLVPGAAALRAYAGGGWTLPLFFAVAYLLGLLAVYELVLWPVAVADRGLPLRSALRRAAELVVRRPGQSVGLTLALLAVNAVGLAAAIVPFLTLTIAYSALAAAHFALPRDPPEVRA